MRPITIHTVLNGYVVHADCQFVVFENKDRLLSELKRYLDNPQEVEAEYINKSTNGYGKPKLAELPPGNPIPMPDTPAQCEAPRTARRGLVEALSRPF